MENKWYQHSGPEGDVVISTRVRLARNIENYPFPGSMEPEQRRQVMDIFEKTLQAAAGPLRFSPMENIAPMEAQSMVERHLISPEFARCEPGSGLLLNEDESVSIMLNEEDHMRLQVLRAGLALEEAYLTQCPTNLGTGMRASIMLHLPALQEHNAIQQLANTVSKLGLTIRGIYGEGSKSEGALYQLSNQVTLGISEQAAIENLLGIASQIIRQERVSRESLSQNPHFEDRVWRSLGLLRTARLLSHDEFMALISNVRVGIAVRVIEGLSLDVIGELLNDAQPATLMLHAGEDMEPLQRDALRARMVRERLA